MNKNVRLSVVDEGNWERYKKAAPTLFKSVFRKLMSPRYLEWRYAGLNNATPYIAVAERDAFLVASYSVSIVDLQIEGNIIKSALSMTTMTHPDYRGQGLFPKLADMIFSKLKEDGIKIVWGFPNAMSYPTFVNKLQWQPMEQIKMMELNNLASSLLEANTYYAYGQKEKVVRDDKLTLNYFPIETSEVRVHKDTRYLRWRYADHPVNKYGVLCVNTLGRVSSYLIFKEFGSRLDVVDFAAAEQEDAVNLMSAAVELAITLDKTALEIWNTESGLEKAVLDAFGFSYGSKMTLVGARFLQSHEKNRNTGHLRRNWCLSMGDSDVY